MRTPLHLDLLKDEERLSSSPIRLRVMLPLMTSLFLLSTLLVWTLLGIRLRSQHKLVIDTENAVQSASPVHASVLASRETEKETRAVIQQLMLYQHSRNAYGTTLANIANYVPTNIQFAEMSIPLPQVPPDVSRPGTLPAAPTNIQENVTLRISGRIGGNRASESINELLCALRSEPFTNAFRAVSIPKGAFRLDSSRGPSGGDALLFEIFCECAPRRFE